MQLFPQDILKPFICASIAQYYSPSQHSLKFYTLHLNDDSNVSSVEAGCTLISRQDTCKTTAASKEIICKCAHSHKCIFATSVTWWDQNVNHEAQFSLPSRLHYIRRSNLSAKYAYNPHTTVNHTTINVHVHLAYTTPLMIMNPIPIIPTLELTTITKI